MTDHPNHEVAHPKRAASLGNRNAMRHGLRASMLPKGCGYIKEECDKLRVQLENAVMNARGELSILEAATIQSAIRHETHARLAARWLRNEAADLEPNERLSFSREVARASTERDKCIRELKLNGKANAIEALFSKPMQPVQVTNVTTEPPKQPDAADAKEGA